MSHREFLGYLALTVVAITFAVILVLAVRILTLPTPGPPAPKTDAPYYVVTRGDTLSAIADKTGIAVEQLMALNRGLDPLALVPGKRISLKESAPPPGKRRRRRRPLPTYYVVMRGDTLSGIAVKFGVPLYRLFELNRAIRRDALLQPGQRIRLRKLATDKRKRLPRRDT